MEPIKSPCFTCKKVAKLYGVREDTVWRWIRQGKLAAVKIGSRNYRIREEDLAEFEREKMK